LVVFDEFLIWDCLLVSDLPSFECCDERSNGGDTAVSPGTFCPD